MEAALERFGENLLRQFTDGRAWHGIRPPYAKDRLVGGGDVQAK